MDYNEATIIWFSLSEINFILMLKQFESYVSSIITLHKFMLNMNFTFLDTMNIGTLVPSLLE